MRNATRMLLTTGLAACLGAAAFAGGEWPRGLTLRFPGQERYGNQPLDAMLATYGKSPSVRSTWMHDFCCALVGGTGGRRETWWNWSDPLCLTMHGGGEAAFACGVDVLDPAMTFPTERAVVVSFRFVTPDGSPLPPRGQAFLFWHGRWHVHPMWLSIGEDGGVSLTLPASVAADPRTEIAALVDGWPALRVPLPRGADSGPVALTLPTGRRVRARIDGALPCASVDLVLPPSETHRPIPVDKAGRIDLRVPADTQSLVLVNGGFAALRIELPESGGDVDLGTLRPETGAAVRGSVKWRRGAPVPAATLAAYDASGVVVATTYTRPSGTFTLPFIGPGEHRLRVVARAADGVMLSRDVSRDGVRAGGADVDFVLPPAITLSFADEAGRPVPLATVTLALTPEGGAPLEPRQLWVNGPDNPVSQAQIDAPGPGRVHVVVRAPGFLPAETDVVVDATGAATATVTLRPR